MKVKELLAAYQVTPQLASLHQYVQEKNASICLKGLVGSAKSVVASALYSAINLSQVFVFNDIEDARYFYADLESLLEGKVINFFPPSFKRSFLYDTFDNNLTLERAETLNRLMRNAEKGELVVTTADAICEMVLSKADLEKNTYQLKVNDYFDIDFFIEYLSEHYFERTDFVCEAGQFAVRGGIVDIYSFSNEKPYRIELNNDVIESIRIFNPDDQLSEKKVDNFFITPNVQKQLDNTQRLSFFNYLPPNAVLWFNDISLTIAQINAGILKSKKSYNQLKENIEKRYLLSDSGLPEPNLFFDDGDRILKYINSFSLIYLGLSPQAKYNITFNMQPQPVFSKNFKMLIDNLKENVLKHYTNLIFSDSSRQIERLYTIFNDIDKEVVFNPVYHALSNGYIDKDLKLACYTEHQIFDRFYKGKTKHAYTKGKILTLKELRELKSGDFVTHADHGIGKFAGLEKIEINGNLQEAVRLVYRDNDLLYVSINSLHKISKYVGKDGTEPRMNKLGSDAWEKLKTTTKKKVKDIARDLIKLYAKRKASEGFAFDKDNYLQIELEASFMYEDTPDQAKATAEVKADMEKTSPMDRLICGDVGFGKTEIAIRAAFKAVCDSKQVAVLVPTTILANQHYRTFKERLKDLPCNVDYVNRFKTAAETKLIIENLAQGKIDIIIGTHKLLSKQTKFKDLGLLIIDEEQKFGVAAKEKIKAFKANVDTLTLTATPIPRTLHFSLMGARDLSIINTPPPNRQPVLTELHNFNDELIREVIIREYHRGGQTFFVHSRVKDIIEIASHIKKICPEINIGVAHGQLEGDKLEDVMVKFIEGEYDVLVATTIIEAGLDISNANTIIINNAQMFGLSDLHQMRGRVGRSNKKAYCYLLVPNILNLTDHARKRLSAIEEFSDLGRGFDVAMRDLDIRGAGNLLGAEQSGFVAEIGFEMYHKVLDEAIHELKEEEFYDLFKDDKTLNKLESTDCNLETDFEALIPDNYVKNTAERLSLYNQLSSLVNDEDFEKFAFDIKDRFGSIPKQVYDLIDLIKLREEGKKLGLEKIILKNKTLMAYFPPEHKHYYYQSELFSKVLAFVNQTAGISKLKQTPKGLTLLIQQVNNITIAQQLLQRILSI